MTPHNRDPLARARRGFRGRRLAWTCASVVAIVLVAGVASSWNSLLETWYLHRLHSPDEGTRNEAAARLGELHSLRAVPELVRMIAADRRETYSYVPVGGVPGVDYSFRFDEPVASELPELCALQGLRVHLTPLAHALYSIGEQAAPLVEASKETAPVLEVVRAFWRRPDPPPARMQYRPSQ